MKDRETLDEAIDRVATWMTRVDEHLRVDIRPIWTEASPAFAQALWRGRPVAVAVGVAAVLLAVVTFRTPRVEPQVTNAPMAGSPAIAWSPLRTPVFEARTRRGIDEDAGLTARPREGRAIEPDRPSWGIPFIDAPASLDVAASTTPAIGLETVAVESIAIEPLTIHAIDRDGTIFPKEQ